MRIAVAMSGGVDSSVAALLLKEEGHEVVGLSMQLWDHSAEAGRTGRCCTLDDLSDARRVAWALGIRHYVLEPRGGVPARRRAAVRGVVPRRRHADPVLELQREGEVRDALGARPGPRLRGRGDRALRPRGSRRPGPGGPAQGRRSRQGPVLLPLRPLARTARGRPLPGRRPDQGAGARARPARGPADGRQGGEPGDLLRRRGTARRRLRGGAGRGARPRSCRPAPDRSRTRRGAGSARTPATSGSRSASGGGSASPPPSGSTSSPSTRRRIASSSDRATTLASREAALEGVRFLGAAPDGPGAGRGPRAASRAGGSGDGRRRDRTARPASSSTRRSARSRPGSRASSTTATSSWAAESSAREVESASARSLGVRDSRSLAAVSSSACPSSPAAAPESPSGSARTGARRARRSAGARAGAACAWYGVVRMRLTILTSARPGTTRPKSKTNSVGLCRMFAKLA